MKSKTTIKHTTSYGVPVRLIYVHDYLGNTTKIYMASLDDDVVSYINVYHVIPMEPEELVKSELNSEIIGVLEEAMKERLLENETNK